MNVKAGQIYRVCNWIWTEDSVDKIYVIPSRIASDGSKFLAETFDTRSDDNGVQKTLCHNFSNEIEIQTDGNFSITEIKSIKDMREAFESILSCSTYSETEDNF